MYCNLNVFLLLFKFDDNLIMINDVLILRVIFLNFWGLQMKQNVTELLRLKMLGF